MYNPPPFGTPCSKSKMWLTLYFRSESDRALMVFTTKNGWYLELGTKPWEGIIKHIFLIYVLEKRRHVLEPCPQWIHLSPEGHNTIYTDTVRFPLLFTTMLVKRNLTNIVLGSVFKTATSRLAGYSDIQIKIWVQNLLQKWENCIQFVIATKCITSGLCTQCS